jgi:hypothetical protein
MDALRTAQALTVLEGAGPGRHALADTLVERLLQEQQQDGSWPVCPAWNAGVPPRPRTVWWGSEALTTAFCLEALNAFARR